MSLLINSTNCNVATTMLADQHQYMKEEVAQCYLHTHTCINKFPIVPDHCMEFPLAWFQISRKQSEMLSEVAGNKMISFGTSFTGGATPASLSTETSSSHTANRHMEASSMPIKSVVRTEARVTAEKPLPRNLDTPAPGSKNLKVQDLNEFLLCFLCSGYKIEATTINECMHSCKSP